MFFLLVRLVFVFLFVRILFSCLFVLFFVCLFVCLFVRLCVCFLVCPVAFLFARLLLFCFVCTVMDYTYPVRPVCRVRVYISSRLITVSLAHEGMFTPNSELAMTHMPSFASRSLI